MPRRRRRPPDHHPRAGHVHDHGHVLTDPHAIYRPGHSDPGHSDPRPGHTASAGPHPVDRATPPRDPGSDRDDHPPTPTAPVLRPAGRRTGDGETRPGHGAPSAGAPPPRLRPVTDAEAAALAWAFALDLESWDEDHPHRRADVIARYLPHAPTGHLGWDGTGRQRSETATTGTVHRHDDTHVTVDIRIRVTPYLRVLPASVVTVVSDTPRHQPEGDTAPDNDTVPDSDTVPAAAPSPTALGWTACDSEWKRLRIPVTRTTTGALVIDLTHHDPGPGTGPETEAGAEPDVEAASNSRALPPPDTETDHPWP